ncbi:MULTISPECIES: helix-turn-helix domain-containing protein [unclassified Ruegeria]|uniref:helix-turn-helix domain-containing protein n=1 Tax=unclassified Ruegeria TaxID=2625375 RepID=UPI0014878392|nr:MULTISPECIES: helix-turn-helix domain-containing protein [unclassified Ruegeria]
MPKTSRRAGVKWRILREKGRFNLSNIMARVDLPSCPICAMDLQNRRAVATLHYAGLSNADIAERIGVTPATVWRHVVRCIPQIIEATHRLERQRDVDHIGDLQKLVLDTLETMKVGIETQMGEGNTAAALQIGADFLDHLDIYMGLLDRVDKHRQRQLSDTIRALCAEIVKLDPIRGADAIDAIIGGNPAVQNVLDEESDNVRDNTYTD